MTLVLTIAQRKGGAGKSTLACQLAAAFADAEMAVTAIDTDEQGSLSDWGATRPETAAPLEVIGADRAASRSLSTLLRHARRAADIVLIDTPPSTDYAVKSAIREADLVLTPIQLSPIDLNATFPTAQLIGETGTNALFVINRAPPRARIADRIRAEFHKNGLPLAASELGNRAAFAESIAGGLGVTEMTPRSKAADEISALMNEVLDHMGQSVAA